MAIAVLQLFSCGNSWEWKHPIQSDHRVCSGFGAFFHTRQRSRATNPPWSWWSRARNEVDHGTRVWSLDPISASSHHTPINETYAAALTLKPACGCINIFSLCRDGVAGFVILRHCLAFQVDICRQQNIIQLSIVH